MLEEKTMPEKVSRIWTRSTVRLLLTALVAYASVNNRGCASAGIRH
jgi:hypothetical protein